MASRALYALSASRFPSGNSRALGEFELESPRLAPFIYGFMGYTVAWWILFKRYFMGSWLSTLEHELTHGLFAVLTLHKILEVKTSYLSGGHIRYTGGGNWLITISPYFFPTLSFIIMGILALLDSGQTPWLNLTLGISVAYHIRTSTWKETHWGQSDLKEVGYFYSFLFYPRPISSPILRYWPSYWVAASNWFNLFHLSKKPCHGTYKHLFQLDRPMCEALHGL